MPILAIGLILEGHAFMVNLAINKSFLFLIGTLLVLFFILISLVISSFQS